jgi:poly(beta-D-mannuronate) lyase
VKTSALRAVLVLSPVMAGHATDHFAPDIGAFNSAVPQLQPGDTLTLANGVWTNVDLVFRGYGTASNPITLRPQVNGRVFISGASRLQLAGNHLVVQGLVFTNGYPSVADAIEFRADGYGTASDCRVTDCAIVDFNPPGATNETKWVSLHGFNNRVDHCYFKGKQNNGALIVVWLPSPSDPDAMTPNHHRIDRNHFGPRALNGGNGGEIIRVGNSDTSLNVSRTVVEHNYFQACDGEIEIISNKSCENLYRYNTFVECAGALTLRHGNGCVVEGNYFFGNGKASTGGVRVMGEDHSVINNYFQDLTGSGGYAALTLMQGLEDSPPNGYVQVVRANLAFNTLVNCSHSLIVGLGATFFDGVTNRTTTLPPLDCTIGNNIIHTTQQELVDQRITPANLTWQGNIMFGTVLGITPPPGILVADPKLVLNADGLWRPGANSPALAASQGDYGFVLDDIRGRLRPAAKDVGSDQSGSSTPMRTPLTPTEVGPSWMLPFRLTLNVVNRSVVSLRWPSVPGAVYQVQTSTGLVAWANISNSISATGSTQTWETPFPSTIGPATRVRHYRVQQLAITNGPP